MKDLKPIDYKLLFELMKDSHRSDRQLAKALGVSQPTVTRRRAMLEEGYTEGYTVIPKFGQIGFELAAFTFLKSRLKQKTSREKDEALKKLKEWYDNQPSVILVVDGRGMGWDVLCISLHESFADFTNFIRAHDSELSEWVVESQSFHVDLKNAVNIKPFHLKYLAKLK
ncbi:AsnC family transcriptional regulator [Candidatus Bathyarchaeota archaeon A05DMB-2]|jgi:DNA-binding Lrp family transcriptional regulator|nr:AsnC family transcriptional regulator [Candidatus Bathyarchaeota archaeon A05DMB-2]